MNVKACYGMYDFVFTTLIYAHAFPRAKLEPASRSGRPRHHGDQPGKLLRNARLRGIFPSSRSATVRAAYGFAARGEEDDLVECLRTQFHIEAVKTSSRQKGFFLADLVSKLPEPRLFRALTRFLVRFSWSRHGCSFCIST